MATKRRLKKKKFKEDRLVTYSVTLSRYAQEHFNQVITGVVILLAVIAATLLIVHSRQTAARDSERYLGAALALYRQGDVAAAKTSFQDVIDRYSGTRAGKVAMIFKGECDLKLGNFEEAASAYDQYLEKSDKFSEFKTTATIGKAIALEGQMRYAEAASTLEALIQVLDAEDPRRTESLYRAGLFCKKAGMMEKAIQYLTEVAEEGIGPFKEEAEIALAAIKAEVPRPKG
ncbi:MAG: tetratricopeptide repeat protein [Candidatus Latescibacteria bacterium]|nr:tetratricopeptide repeat protein [Candidatus Latescibacterota bacterium]NIM21470.1 tetratricopeptide repeat protein [Candidatus Latescibacterota bacterium]NIM65641.1 tetratricopeptide repeat protein [Candidatus Latescibacterota bacterium]NIO02023.1 tetratricopeptide repeat protein [Candidatus Latescibacterota bacterium]NIO28835.1 tetratricopeptide repeat protein [Candidatus Latescibacterota bacterium]